MTNEKNLELAKVEAEIEELENRLFYLNMADRLYGKEKEEWEELNRKVCAAYTRRNKLKGII